MLNEAGYTATLVAGGWAGAIYQVTRLFGQEKPGNKAGYTAISCGRVGRGGNATVRN